MSDKMIEITDAWIIKHLGESALRNMSGELYSIIEEFLMEVQK